MAWGDRFRWLHAVGAAGVVLAALVGAPACHRPGYVDVTDYDQTCVADPDCVLVQDGDICCGCPNAAINANELERYEESLPTCDSYCDNTCGNDWLAYCDEGTCAVLLR